MPNDVTIRDFHGGRYAPYAIDTFLCPDYTVSDSLNVNFDTTIGSMTVRPGTTLLGANVVSNKNPLGLANYVTQKGTVYNRAIAVFSGASTASVYYYNGSWNTSGLTNLNNTAKCRFAMLGNQMFIVNGKQKMQSSSNGGQTWGTTNCIDSSANILPATIIRAKARILVSGSINDTTGSPSRVWFSNVVVPGNPGSVVFSTNATTGAFIDVNPDDGDSVTAFANTSTFTLVFKNYAMYRLDVVNSSVDTDNIFNLGTPSQEAVTTCQGIVYFFSGPDIRSTSGDFPQQISRLGVQDYIDSITQANWTSVVASNDGINVYFSIGNITLNTNKDNQKTINNVVLKFSPRDQSWSVHSYAQSFQSFTNITTTGLTGIALLAGDTAGNVQSINNGTTDNGSAIFFEAYTQEQEFGNRAHKKIISNEVAFFTKSGMDSSVELYPDGNDVVKIPSAKNLVDRVTIATDINVTFKFLKFRWFGSTSGASPVFQGIHIPEFKDVGLIK